MPELNDQIPSEDEDFDITSKDSEYASTDAEVEPESQSQTVPSEEGRIEVSISSEAESEANDDSEPDDDKPEPESAEVSTPSLHKQPASKPELSDIKPRTPTTIRPISQTNGTNTPLLTSVSSSAASESAASKSKLFTWHYVIELVLVVLVVILAIFAWSLNSDKHDLTKEVASLNSNPQAAVQKQTQGIISAVANLMQLPKGETPTVASVTDVAAAKKQSSFFDNAENGDKVLLYVKSGEAILYRPSTDKIILVAPLTFTPDSTN
jgi:hypothetical protein